MAGVQNEDYWKFHELYLAPAIDGNEKVVATVFD